MPRFKKKIVSPGLYRIKNPITNEIREELVTPERIQHWANEGRRYLQNGNRLPGPWTHIDPQTGAPIIVSANGVLPRSDLNGGFWDRLYTEFDPVDGLSLIGEIEGDGDLNDANTPAGKIGRTVKETSIFALPEWTDGKGNTYRDVPLHIALVTHPIQPGQTNFESLPTGSLAIAMSNLVYPLKMANPPSSIQGSTDPPSPYSSQGNNRPGQTGQGGGDPNSPTSAASGADINQVLAALRQCGIDLPDDTNPMNFFERLLVAARQKAVSEGSAGGDLYNQPEGAMTQQPAPVAMATNPAPVFDFSKITQEVLMSHPVVKSLVESNNQLQELVLSSARAALQTRIAKLLSEGRITEKYATEVLKPLIDGFAMSQIGKSPVEAVLTALEAAPAPVQRPAAPHHNNASLLLGTAMSQIPTAAGNAPENPYVQGGVEPNGAPRSAQDIVKDFFEATGGERVYG